MHWLTLKFRDPSHEQAFRQHALARLVWVDFLLVLIVLGIYTAWAAVDYGRWKVALVTSLTSWPAVWRLVDPPTPAQQQLQQSCIAGDLQDVCSASGDPQLMSIRSHLLTAMICGMVGSSVIGLMKCWLILFNRRWFFEHFTTFVSVDWWCVKLLSLGAGTAYCTLLTPGLDCGVVTLCAAFLAFTTSLHLTFQRSLVYNVVFSILWSAVQLLLPIGSGLESGARQQLSIAVMTVGLQYVIETCARVFYAKVIATTAAAAPQSTTSAEAADPESDCDADPVDPPEINPAGPVTVQPSSNPLQEQQKHNQDPPEPREQHQPHSSNPGVRRRSSAAASAAAAAAAAAAAVASSSAAAAEAAAAGSPTVVVAALPAVAEVSNEGQPVRPQPGASLVYESPLLHRTIGVKVYSTSGMSRELAASRLATSVQAALDSLPQGARVVDHTEHVGQPNPSGAGSSRQANPVIPSADAVLVSRVLVPGCVMLLGTVVTRRQQQQQLQLQQAKQQRETAAAGYFTDGIWRMQLSGTCSTCNGSDSKWQPAVPFKYGTVQELEAAIQDGSFAANMQTWLDNTAAAAHACEDSYLPQEQYLVSSYGSDVHMVLQAAGQSGCSCSGGSLPVRLVLAKGNSVIVDQQPELQQVTTGYQTRAKANSSSNTWEIKQRLPTSMELGGKPLSNSAVGCVLTLRLLSPQLSDSDSSGTMDSGSEGGTAADSGQYASITALLLPQAAAAEAQAWIQRNKVSQKRLQPLLRDMAVALQAAGMAAAAHSATDAAVTAERLDGTSSAEDRSVLTAAVAASAGDGVHALQLPSSYWSTAADAAARAQQYLAAQGLSFCSNAIGGGLQQIQQMGAKGVPDSVVLAAAEKRAAGAAKAAVDASYNAIKGPGARTDANNRLFGGQQYNGEKADNSSGW